MIIIISLVPVHLSISESFFLQKFLDCNLLPAFSLFEYSHLFTGYLVQNSLLFKWLPPISNRQSERCCGIFGLSKYLNFRSTYSQADFKNLFPCWIKRRECFRRLLTPSNPLRNPPQQKKFDFQGWLTLCCR